MKSVLVVASYSASLANFRGPLIAAMRNRQHKVHACAPGLTKDLSTLDWLVSQGVVCHDVPLSRTGLNPFKDIVALVALARLMRQTRPDLFLGYTIKPVIWGTLAARLANVPKRVALITGLGYAFTGEAAGLRAFVQRIARGLYLLAMRSAHLVFFQNPDDRDDFRKLGLLPENVAVELVNGSGVDLDHFAAVALPERAIRFLLIARLLGDKGIREYVQAAKQLSKKWPDAEFHLVGGLDQNPNGIPLSEVEEWTRENHVVWQGALEDVRPAIAQCHVYVLPSYREGTPRTVLEAMAMGRAVVTTDAPGCRETVDDGINGFKVTPRDVESLAAAMERFLVDPALVISMSIASRQIVAAKYDVNKVNARMIDAMGL